MSIVTPTNINTNIAISTGLEHTWTFTITHNNVIASPIVVQPDTGTATKVQQDIGLAL